ncbi:calcineurin b [Anaeramoeba flamelloides]|uniref:Calcineurin b n=1 Tax=Anaeramoeba flamelloides TaxID=1746091 RepID=A0ABQ8XML0_9EUKA|nr:calcineurin b [Anaeramoeba flamelloides]
MSLTKKYGETLSNNEIEQLVKVTGFNEEQIPKLYTFYKKIAGSRIKDGIIDNVEFEQALGLKGSIFAERLFNDNNGELDFNEFCMGLNSFASNGSFVDRLKLTFSVYDINGDGGIDKSELKLLLTSCLKDNFRLTLTEEDLQKIIDKTFEQIDTDNNGRIDYNEYATYARKNPRIMDNLSITLPFLN